MPHEDPVLSELLRPDRAVEHASLLANRRGYVVYEARFLESPPSDYEQHYLRLIQARGVLIQPVNSSPHALPARTFGYFVRVVLPSRKVPFTLRYAVFDTRDHEWLKEHPLFSAPSPVRLDGHTMTVRIGSENQRWTEVVLVPNEDVETVKEFPFRRYPGAILKHVGRLRDQDLLDRAELVRSYVLHGADYRSVGVHYEAELKKLGIEDARAEIKGLLFWRGRSRIGFDKVVVGGTSLGGIPGWGLGLPELRELLPAVFEGFPAGLWEYTVQVRFDEPSAKVPYLSPADQERYRTLTSTKTR